MKFQKPTGTKDLFQDDLKIFQKIEKTAEEIAGFYGFEKIETPILEQSGLFEKGTGISTEIAEKQMFNLRTKGGDCLTLRPEFTPSIIRAYLEHGFESMAKPVKLWSFGPVFRHERPQAGRWREFYQLNLESIGSPSWIIDAQIILIFFNILKKIGLSDIVVELNSVGDSACRPYYKKVLTGFLRRRRNSFCPDCQRRLKENPLRVLDCKNEKCREIVASGAPQILDHLCENCQNHFKQVLESLEILEIPYNLNPYLVRGLDYYTRTVFEIIENSPEAKEKGSLAGGGRYDNLVKLLGGKDTAACGAALGVDRTAEVLRRKAAGKEKEEPMAEIFLAQIGCLAKMKGLKMMEEFRKEKIKIIEGLSKDSLSAQLKTADRLEIKFVLILGQKEALDNRVIVRDMKTGSQKIVPIEKAAREMGRKVK